MGRETRTRGHEFLVNRAADSKAVVNVTSAVRFTNETRWLEESEVRELREEGGDQTTPALLRSNGDRP